MDVQDVQKILDEPINKLTMWGDSFLAMLPNLGLSVFVIIIFHFVAKITRKVVKKLLERSTENVSVNRILAGTSYTIVLSFGIFFSLNILGLEKTLTSLLAGAGIIGLGLSFAFQEIIANFVSGIIISFTKPYYVHDIIQVNDYLGEVVRINLRTTHVMTFQGLEVLIPNKYMFTNSFTNLTTTPKRRIDMECGVSYGEDLRKVTQVAKEALEHVENRVTDEPVEVYFQGFGSSSIDFVAHVWVKYPGMRNYLKSKHQCVVFLKEAFDKNGITIPFPIRTLDFGIKGGTTLSQNLEQGQTSFSEKR